MARQPATRVAVGFLAAALALAGCGSRLQPTGISPSPTSSSSVAASPLPTFPTQSIIRPSPRPSVPPLGRTLAGVRLEMKQAEVISILGDPPKRETSPGAGLPLWIYGPVALEWSGQGPDAPLYAIHVSPPFAGRTVEGLGLGDDRDAVLRTYGSYPIVTNPGSMRVVDDIGTSILAFFDSSGRIAGMELYVGDPLSRR